jgi:hypothetical protein
LPAPIALRVASSRSRFRRPAAVTSMGTYG